MGRRRRMKKLILLLALVSVPAHAGEGDKQCLAEAVYYEARDQGWVGMLAVGIVVQNRVRSSRYPDDICSVVHQGRYWKGNPVRHKCQFSYFCDGKPERPTERKPWAAALNISSLLLSNSIEVVGLEDATHYHTTNVQPRWSKSLTFRRVIGDHVFYTEK